MTAGSSPISMSAPAAEPQLGGDGEHADRHAVQHRLAQPLVVQERDDRHRGHVRPQQPAQRAVARLPLRLRQCAAMRQHGTDVPDCVP